MALAQLLLDRPNVLLLDEPTNHLDIASSEALENALAGFVGTILCVSHDRYFLEKTVRRLLVLDPPNIVSFDGTYSAWTRKLAEHDRRSGAIAPRIGRVTAGNGSQEAQRRQSLSAPFGRLSTEELEKQITETEMELAECQAQFGDAGVMREALRVQSLQGELEALSKKLVQLEEEYFAREM